MSNNNLTVSERLAKLGLNLKLGDIDKRTLDNAKVFFLDCLGTMLSGKLTLSAEAVYQAVSDMGGKPESTLFGYGEKTSPMMAALYNGTAGHSQDFDDDHREGVLHSSVCVLPTVLAIAELLGKSGEEVLKAYIYGSEITIRLGEAFLGQLNNSGFHPTGPCGVFGATGAAGLILGLTEEQLVNAFGIAGSQAAGLAEFNVHGTWTKRFHAGHAAMAGVLSGYMAKRGFTGPSTVIEGENGFLKSFAYQSNYDVNLVTDQFGNRWEMADNSIKLHSCCRFTCNFADCGIDLHNQGVDPADIESIHAECNNFTIVRLCNPEEIKRHPKNTVNAQFSLPWAIAVGIKEGKVLIPSFLDDVLNDPVLWDLCEKTTWEENAEFEAVYPKHYPARVTVKTKSGKTYVAEIQYPKGDPENPATKEEVIEKFRFTSGYVISKEKTDKIIELVDNLEKLPNLSDLIDCMY